MIPACRLQSRARRPARHGFESHWGCDSLQTKLLIVGDSVMGGFVQASGDVDASPDAALDHSVLFKEKGPGREGILIAPSFADPFLPGKRPLLP